MKRFLPWILLVVVATAAAGVIWYLRHQVREESLARENAEASRDSAFTVAGGRAKRMLQLELDKDSLDRALKTQPKVEIRTVVRVKEVTTTSSAPVTASADGDTLKATLRSDSTWHPYHGEIAVTLPRPDSASPAPRGTVMLNRLGIAPIPVTVKVRCGEDGGAGGVRKAFTTAQDVPAWASIDLGQPIADPDVCSPAPKSLQLRLNAPTIAVIGVAGLLGLLAGVVAF